MRGGGQSQALERAATSGPGPRSWEYTARSGAADQSLGRGDGAAPSG